MIISSLSPTNNMQTNSEMKKKRKQNYFVDNVNRFVSFGFVSPTHMHKNRYLIICWCLKFGVQCYEKCPMPLYIAIEILLIFLHFFSFLFWLLPSFHSSTVYVSIFQVNITVAIIAAQRRITVILPHKQNNNKMLNAHPTIINNNTDPYQANM